MRVATYRRRASSSCTAPTSGTAPIPHPSNAEFDESLKARDPAWGIRNLEDVIDRAVSAGLDHVETVEMPANNLTVVYRQR